MDKVKLGEFLKVKIYGCYEDADETIPWIDWVSIGEELEQQLFDLTGERLWVRITKAVED